MKIVLFANTEWYLWNFRRSLAVALRDAGHDVLLIPRTALTVKSCANSACAGSRYQWIAAA